MGDRLGKALGDARGLLAGKLARGAVFAFAIHGVGALLTYITQIFLARWLGAGDYGVYALVHSWALLIALVVGLGLPPAALRFLPEYAAKGAGSDFRRFLRFARLSNFALALLCALAIQGLLGLGFLSAHGAGWRVGAWLIPSLVLLNLHMQVGRATGSIGAALSPQFIFKPILVLGGVWVAGRFIDDLSGGDALAILGLSLAALALAQFAFVQRRLPSLPDESAGGAPPAWLGVAFPLLLFDLFSYLLATSDVLMVGAFMDDAAVGIYNAASKTASAASFAFYAVNAVGTPAISDRYSRGDRAGLEGLIRKTGHGIFWPALVIAGGLAAVGPRLLRLFGQEFAAAYDELLILLVAYVLSASMGLASQILNMTGRQARGALIFGCAALLNLALNFVLIPRFGTRGAAIATGSSMLFWNVLLWVAIRRELGLSPFVFARRGGAR